MGKVYQSRLKLELRKKTKKLPMREAWGLVEAKSVGVDQMIE